MRVSPSILLVLLGNFAIAQISPSSIVFNETFEGVKFFSDAHAIETGRWDYALQYVSNPVYRGSRAVRFEIREDQLLVKNGKRAEVVVIKGLPGKNMWYSFAVYFPSGGFNKDSERDVINQWYQDGSPATSLRVRNDRLYLETGPELSHRMQLDIAPITKDTWHEFVFHFIHSHESNGLIEVWYDDKKVITHRGGNMYDDVMPKWKIGLYKAAFKFGTSDVSKRIIFFDNIKVGTEKSTYELMKPNGQND
jgi:hypothetical protein